MLKEFLNCGVSLCPCLNQVKMQREVKLHVSKVISLCITFAKTQRFSLLNQRKCVRTMIDHHTGLNICALYQRIHKNTTWFNSFVCHMPALTNTHVDTICKTREMKQERPWRITPPPCHGPQTKTVLHGSALRIPDLSHQQHFTPPSTRHSSNPPTKPANSSTKAPQEGQRQLTPVALVSLGCYCSI